MLMRCVNCSFKGTLLFSCCGPVFIRKFRKILSVTYLMYIYTEISPGILGYRLLFWNFGGSQENFKQNRYLILIKWRHLFNLNNVLWCLYIRVHTFGTKPERYKESQRKISQYPQSPSTSLKPPHHFLLFVHTHV